MTIVNLPVESVVTCCNVFFRTTLTLEMGRLSNEDLTTPVTVFTTDVSFFKEFIVARWSIACTSVNTLSIAAPASTCGEVTADVALNAAAHAVMLFRVDPDEASK